MSIFPKKLKKGQDLFTTFHMKICNNGNEDIIGKIDYKIIKPNGEIDTIVLKEKVNANSETNRYDKYYLKNPQLGRYYVEGRFIWDENDILSETNKNDFFDVE